MNDENKEPTTGAETAAEQVNAPKPESTLAKEQKGKTGTKAKQNPKADSGAGALRAVGVEACKRHGLEQVWVTSDGQAFAQENDAKAHAVNLESKETIKVTPK